MATGQKTGWFRRSQRHRDGSIRVLTAAATRVKLGDRDEARRQRALRQGWQSDAWTYRDSIGELRYAIQFLANCTSRMRLFPAAYDNTSSETTNPVALKELNGVPPDVAAVCNQAMTDLGDGRLAIAGMLQSLSTNLTVAGECNLLGRTNPLTGMDDWTIRSIDEIVITDDVYKLREVPTDPNGAVPWQDLDPSSTVVSRIWTPHPRFHLLADSPLRAIMDDCESLMILRRMIRATGRSRLAGRGLLLVPDELTIKVPNDDNQDPNADPFMQSLAEAMMEPIGDEGAASAVVPIVVRGPGAMLDQVKHIDFASTFDEESKAVREELIGVIATGLDLPKEIIVGVADLNHWTAWQVDDNTFRHHVEPHVVTCVDSLTDAYLRPYLEAAGVDPAWIQRCAIWYDPVELVTHPDQTKDAFELHDRLAISDETLRDTAGFSEEDKPDPAEIQIRLIQALRNWPPNLIMAFLHQLDPTLVVPPITTAGTIPGLKPGGVDTGEVPAAPSVPGAPAPAPTPGGPSVPPSPPRNPSAPTPGPATPPPGAPVTAAGRSFSVPTDDDGDPSGVMVAFYLPPALARQVAVAGGEPVEDLHVTLAFLGEATELTDQPGLLSAVEAWADETEPITGVVSGVGLFTAGPEPVTYLSIDCPDLPEARQRLVDGWLEDQPVSELHGFTPHCTLAYSNLIEQVQAMGGDSVEFTAVSVRIGSERTDFPLGKQPAAIVAAAFAAKSKSERLSRKLTEIDRDLRARLQTATNAAMMRQLERAGARLRTKVAKDETLRGKIAHRPNELVAAALGEEVVVAAGLSAKELMGGDWSSLGGQFHGWTEAAQKRALAVARQMGNLDVESDAYKAAEAAMDTGRAAAWGMLEDSLTRLGQTLLYNPHPDAGDILEAINPDTVVPAGFIRAALVSAGGGQLEGAYSDGAFSQPLGQIGTGATITELLTSGGMEQDRYEWVHGPSLNPFEPHEALDGAEFANFDDSTLANDGDFPDNAFYLPGDHNGCLCDFTPLWVAGGSGDGDVEEA